MQEDPVDGTGLLRQAQSCGEHGRTRDKDDESNEPSGKLRHSSPCSVLVELVQPHTLIADIKTHNLIACNGLIARLLSKKRIWSFFIFLRFVLFCLFGATLGVPVVAPGTAAGPLRRVVEAPLWVPSSPVVGRGALRAEVPPHLKTR